MSDLMDIKQGAALSPSSRDARASLSLQGIEGDPLSLTSPRGDTRQGEIDQEQARDALRVAQKTEGKSTAALARLIGVGESTLSAWLANKYTGRNDEVAAKVNTWLDARPAQARVQATAAHSAFVMTTTAEAFMAALEHAQFVPDLVVIAGGAGVGKTTCTRQYERTHRNVWMLTGEPALSTAFSVLERLCGAMGVREYTPVARSREITRKLCGSGGLLIVDEAQHLSTSAIEQLRSIHDVAGVGLALVGNQSVYARIDGGGRRAEFAQLFSRVGMRVRRDRPLARDIDALLDMNEITDGASRRLLRAIGGKPGALRGMIKTLRVARMMALAAETDLVAEHIRLAWSRVSDAAPLEDGG